MGPTKYKWDPHDLVGPMWILTNQKECVLEGVLLTFLFMDIRFYMWELLNGMVM